MGPERKQDSGQGHLMVGKDGEMVPKLYRRVATGLGSKIRNAVESGKD